MMVEQIEPTLALSEHFNYRDYLMVDLVEHSDLIPTSNGSILSYKQTTTTHQHNYQPAAQAELSCFPDNPIHYYDCSVQKERDLQAYYGKNNTNNSNINREKKRLNNINSAFEKLKEVIPTFPFEKRLTKMETLRLAISYISMLEDILESEMRPDVFLHKVLQGDMQMTCWYTHELSARLNWLRWENLGMFYNAECEPGDQWPVGNGDATISSL